MNLRPFGEDIINFWLKHYTQTNLTFTKHYTQRDQSYIYKTLHSERPILHLQNTTLRETNLQNTSLRERPILHLQNTTLRKTNLTFTKHYTQKDQSYIYKTIHSERPILHLQNTTPRPILHLQSTTLRETNLTFTKHYKILQSQRPILHLHEHRSIPRKKMLKSDILDTFLGIYFISRICVYSYACYLKHIENTAVCNHMVVSDQVICESF